MTWLLRYARPLLIAILAFTFVTRIYNLQSPPTYVFDEVYHAITAKLIARNDTRAYEWWNPPVEPNTAVDWLHPPLAKYTQAIGIIIFGENAFGWRVSSAIFGVGVVFLVYKLAESLFKNPAISLTSAFLASLDGLLLVQSRVAMNDIHVTFFILLTLWSFLQYKQSFKPEGSVGWGRVQWIVATGISAGLAVSAKWSGVFAVGVIWLFELLQLIKVLFIRRQFAWFSLVKHILLILICWLVIPAAIYVGSYSHMFLQGKEFNHFQELHRQIWWYQTNLTATHGYQSRPWQWFLNLRPVWYYVAYDNGQVGNIYALANPVLIWLGDISIIVTAVIVLAGIYDILRQLFERARALKSYFHLPQLSFLLVAYLAVWLPWQLSPRIMFFYHYTPAIPLLCIILAYWLISIVQTKEWQPWGKVVSIGLVTLVAITFLVFYPDWTGIPVSAEFANRVYFSIQTWK